MRRLLLALIGQRGFATTPHEPTGTTAIFAAFTQTDEERLRRCLCDNLFPACPPELGKAPYFVPISCLRGSD